MDRQAQLKRLVWLCTADIKARKLYAWAEAQALEKAYSGICEELKNAMTGRAVTLASESLTQAKPPLAGKK